MAAVLLVLLALSYATMVVTAPIPLLLPFVIAAVVSYLAGEALNQWYPGPAAWLQQRMQMGHGMRFALRQVIVLVLAAELVFPGPGDPLVWVFSCYILLHGIRPLFAAMSSTVARRRRLPVEWRNLDLPSLELPQPVLPRLTSEGLRWTFYVDVLPLAGVAAVGFGAPYPVLPVTAVLAVAAALVFPALIMIDRIRLLGRPRDEEVRRVVRDAVAAHAPQVVGYFAGGKGTAFALDTWLGSYERLAEPTVVYIRERSLLETIAPTRLPIVVLPHALDLEYFQLPTLKLALYSMNNPRDNHFVRLPGVKDVFIGHGDSDKGSSFNPLARMYDEVWVAGPAGRDRYRRADVGVHDEQVREIGRPQLAELFRASAEQPARSGHPTVLYAPTWGGDDHTLEYSSLTVMGRQVVSALLALDATVLFRPHPRTGDKGADYADALAGVTELVRSAGGDHRVLDADDELSEPEEGLYEALARADVLVTDISAVITDFVALDRPYIVTNPRGHDPAEFRQAFPSAAGGYLLDPDCGGLADMVADGLGEDSLAEKRGRAAAYLLGDGTSEPAERFQEAVSRLVALQAAEDAETGYAPGWYDAELGASTTS